MWSILNIKPLSVNEAWQGRRFKTDKYKAFERDMLIMMPNIGILPNHGPLVVCLKFWVSNMAADIDNPIKMTIDCLQKRYGFNDNRIVRLEVEKLKAAKGEEKICFSIQGWNR